MSQNTSVAPSVASLGSGAHNAIADHFTHVFDSLLHEPHVERTPHFLRAVTGEPHPFGNFAIMSAKHDAASTNEAAAPLCSQPASAVFFLTDTIAPPISAALEQQGFVARGAMPTMAVDIERMTPCALPDGYTFRRCDGECDVWAKAFAAGYQIPYPVAHLLSGSTLQPNTRADAPFQYFTIERDGEMVATSLLVLHRGLAGIYGVSTIPEERGQGLGAFATAEPLRLASALGYRVGVLQSSDMGQSVYERLGFQSFGGIGFAMKLPEQA